MENQDQLNTLLQGTKVWNDWRANNLNIVPDLQRVNLSGVFLSEANLSGADLSGVRGS